MTYKEKFKNWIPLIGLGCLGILCGVFMEAGDKLLRIWGRDEGLNPKDLDVINWGRMLASFRFVWAPIFTWSLGNLWNRRSWIVLLSVIGIFFLYLFTVLPFFSGLFIIVMVIATLARYSLYILADASQMDAVPRAYWGFSESLYYNGYLVGISLTSAGALLLSHKGYSWPFVYFCISILILIMTLGVWRAPLFRFLDKKTQPISLRNFGTPILSWLKQPHGIFLCCFMALYSVQDGFIEPQRDLFLLHIGVSKLSLAKFYTFALWGEILGTVLAAFSVRYKGYFWTLMTGLIINGVIILGIFTQSFNMGTVAGHGLLLTNFLFLQIMRGFVFTGFYSFQLLTCQQNYVISQLAFIEAISQFGTKLASLRSGWIAYEWGWSSLFVCALAANLVILLFLKSISHMSFFNSTQPSRS